MATFNAAAVSNTTIGYEKGITMQTGRALRDNPQSAFEGALNAYRLQLAALPRIGVGDTTKCGPIESEANSSGDVVTPFVELGILQKGSIRVYSTRVSAGGSAEYITVSRRRAGVGVVQASNTDTPQTVDVDVEPGDMIRVSAGATFGSGGGTVTLNVSLRCGENDLWPGQGMFGYIKNNAEFPTS